MSERKRVFAKRSKEESEEEAIAREARLDEAFKDMPPSDYDYELDPLINHIKIDMLRACVELIKEDAGVTSNQLELIERVFEFH